MTRYFAVGIAFAGAVALACFDKSGWGWLVFAGLFVAVINP